MHNKASLKRNALNERIQRSVKNRYAGKKLICLLIYTLFSFLMVSDAIGNLSITPQIKEVEINRGGWTDFSIRITNNSQTSIPLVLFAMDMDISETGSAFVVADGYDRGCSEWIKFSTDEFFLEPRESQTVNVRVRAPKDAEGSYYASLICREAEPKDFIYSDKDKSSMGLSFTVQTVSLFLLTINSSRNMAIIKPDTVMLTSGQENYFGPVAETVRGNKGGWKVEVKVLNTGNIYTKASGQVSIYTESGDLVGRALLMAGKGYVFPNRLRTFTSEGQRSLSDGTYLVSVNLRSREGRSGRGTVAFTIFNGEVFAGTSSEELHSLLDASKSNFTLSERFIEIEITPSSHRTRGVIITNKSQERLVLIPHVLNWVVDETGNPSIVKAEESSYSRSCASWVEIQPDTLYVPPGRKKSTRIKIKSPETLNGEYYSAVRFDKIGSKENIPLEFQMPRTLLVAVSAKGTLKPSAELVSFIHKRSHRRGAIFEIKLENTGNVHCYLKGSIEILNSQGEKVGESIDFGSASEFIFPGTTLSRLVTWEGYLDPGKYTAGLMLTYNEKAKGFRRAVHFSVE